MSTPMTYSMSGAWMNRLQQHLDRIESVGDFDRLIPLLESVGVRDDAVRCDESARQEIDRDRVAVRTQVRTAHVELLPVADDRPVDRRVGAEHRELDVAPELPDDVESLSHAGRRSGGF